MNGIHKVSSRPIPKRGQVKVGIVCGLAHSLASFFSHIRLTTHHGAKPNFGGGQIGAKRAHPTAIFCSENRAAHQQGHHIL
ncbi:hypothetical protein AMTRI_Chr02g261780 [Amborella trichopoda]